MREDRSSHHDQGMDKYVAPAATYQMTVRDYIVRPSASAAIVISLPPVGEARGRIYTIVAQLATNTNTITIRDFTSTGFAGGDSERWEGNVVLNEKGRGATFYSDGMKWHFGGLTFTSALVAGAVNLHEVNLTTGAVAGAQTIDASRSILTIPAGVGNSAGAFFAQINFSTTVSRVAGLAYAIGAEMILPNVAAIASGHYTCLDFELSAGDTVTWAGGTKVSYMRFAAWGTQTEIDDNVLWFTLAGNSALDHLISLNAHTIRCQIEDIAHGLKSRFVLLSTVQNSLTMVLNHVTAAEIGLSMTIDQTIGAGTHVGNLFQLSSIAAASTANSYTMSVRNTVAAGFQAANQRGVYIEVELFGTGAITGTQVGLMIETYSDNTSTLGADCYGILISHFMGVTPAASSAVIRRDYNGAGTLLAFDDFHGAATNLLHGNAVVTNFLLAGATGQMGCTISADGMTANPDADNEAGYITISVQGNSYQIPFYAA